MNPLVAAALGCTLRRHPVLANLDLEVEAGTVHALVGLNGAGKTTLIRLLLGMLAPTSGRAVILGQDARTAPPSVWRRVGHLVETPFAYPELTARENLLAAGLLRGLDAHTIARRATELIDALGMGPWADRRLRTLSLGTRQKVGLAAALLHRPDVLVLDEPANSLDPLAVLALREQLSDAVGRGTAVMVSSHHLDELARYADRISVLHRGAVVGTLSAGEPDLEHQFFETVRVAELTATAPR